MSILHYRQVIVKFPPHDGMLTPVGLPFHSFADKAEEFLRRNPSVSVRVSSSTKSTKQMLREVAAKVERATESLRRMIYDTQGGIMPYRAQSSQGHDNHTPEDIYRCLILDDASKLPHF